MNLRQWSPGWLKVACACRLCHRQTDCWVEICKHYSTEIDDIFLKQISTCDLVSRNDNRLTNLLFSSSSLCLFPSLSLPLPLTHSHGDVLQLAAAAELYARDWRYHKDERLWLTRAPGMEPTMKSGTYEQGRYYVFDLVTWRKLLREMHIEYASLEDRPHLPMPQQQQQQSQHQQQLPHMLGAQ